MKLNGTAEQLRSRLAGAGPHVQRDDLAGVESALESIKSQIDNARVRAQQKADTQFRTGLAIGAADAVKDASELAALSAEVAKLEAHVATLRAELTAATDAVSARLQALEQRSPVAYRLVPRRDPKTGLILDADMVPLEFVS